MNIYCFRFEPLSGGIIFKLTSSILSFLGFNSTETKIQTPDGKVWKEEDFHNLSREIYRDLSQQFAGEDTTEITFHSRSSLFIIIKTYLVFLNGQNVILLILPY